MKTWVITGGVASGKSMFCEMLLTLQPEAVLFSSDEIVHDLLGAEEVVKQVSQIFDSTILDVQGAIDRTILRDRAFSNEKGRKQLEALLHPMVYAQLDKDRLKASENGVQLFIAEVPLFYETKSQFQADLVILVAACDTFQRRRLMELRGLDADAVQRVLSAQLPLKRKLAMAQSVVWNECSPDLLQAQAQLLLQQL